MEVLEWTENYNEIEIALIREYNTLVPNGYTQCSYHLTEKQLDEIIWLLSNSKCPMSEIAKYYNINKSAVVSINVGRNHYNPDIKYLIRTFKGNKHSQPVETILVNRSTTVTDTQLEMGICNK